MTEKRFTLKNWNDYAEGDCIYYDNGEEMGSLDVLDTLNELDEKWINELNLRETLQLDLQRVEEENKHLKQGIIDCLFKGESLQIFAEEMGLIECLKDS